MNEVKRKVELEDELSALNAVNIYGMSLEDRIKLEIRIVERRKELYTVNQRINDYIEGKKEAL